MPMAIIGNYDYCLIFYDITSRHTYDVAKALVQSTYLLTQTSSSETAIFEWRLSATS